MDELGGLVCRQVCKRLVVGDARVVDEQRQRLGRAERGDRLDAVGGGEVGHDDPHLDIGERLGQLVEPLLTATDHDQIVTVAREALGEGPADPGGRACDESERRHELIMAARAEPSARSKRGPLISK